MTWQRLAGFVEPWLPLPKILQPHPYLTYASTPSICGDSRMGANRTCGSVRGLWAKGASTATTTLVGFHRYPCHD